MIRAIIADDEPVAMRHLKKILAELHSNIEIIGEVTDPDQIFPMVTEKHPDVIFLDIDFNRKDINGLILADKISERFPAAMIIYISAHNEFKSEAWERKAVILGYIDKPFNKVKVERVLLKIARYTSYDRIEIKDKSNILHYLSPSEIVMFEREKNAKNTIVHCDSKKINTSESLTSIEKKLEGSKKLSRVNRSYIINITKIDQVSLFSKSSYIVRFKKSACEAFIGKETARELELISR
ncbi:LytTR family DNA-binding domain-containing protein [Pelotomaculum isophthalicicum JI]|uniref:Stage 0 sporulation protein A homolog n=1 Tax=Pelotomaculum isophthalicicum JI TaxID=947010 RepID=A0A9X4H155_9FIRM|nr:LytTR family DNA-binding domain-containing protein [Pelotomaculum isophthalicicum]MDF9407800.1 LytTR family DNA-binding domain-containing protein [Pelotomaculum isophthalicicum JI]